MTEEMSDDSLIGYALLHCDTPRALFHTGHLARLHAMAGLTDEAEALEKQDNFYSVHADYMEPLVEKIRVHREYLKNLPVDNEIVDVEK